MNALFIMDLDLPSIFGKGGGSTNSFMPDRKIVALKIKMAVILSSLNQSWFGFRVALVTSFNPPTPKIF